MRSEKAILTLAEKQCVGMKHRLWKICNSNGDIPKNEAVNLIGKLCVRCLYSLNTP